MIRLFVINGHRVSRKADTRQCCEVFWTMIDCGLLFEKILRFTFISQHIRGSELRDCAGKPDALNCAVCIPKLHTGLFVALCGLSHWGGIDTVGSPLDPGI
jgi:hypothetical protein